MSLNLLIDHGDEIAMPASILESDLSVSEIGAIYFFSAVQGGLADIVHPLTQTPEMVAAMKSLTARGVVSAKLEGKVVRILIDLSKITPT